MCVLEHYPFSCSFACIVTVSCQSHVQCTGFVTCSLYGSAGERFVTFDGIAKACAEAMGKPEPELIHFNPKDFDFGKKKSFPMRDQHFFASIDKAEKLLGWRPKYGLVEGLRDSYQLVCFHLVCFVAY